MNIYRYPDHLPEFRNAVLTIGTFDGVHKGHQKILRQMQDLAHELKGESVVITFDPHPRSIIYPQDTTLRLISTLEERLLLFDTFGVDNVVIVDFSIEFSQQLPREYIENFLLKKFSPKAIVIGYDHRFGRNREGSINLLETYASDHGFRIIEIPEQEVEQLSISSTKIREAIQDGSIRFANKLLNHPFILTGKVVHGKKLGNALGFPTANLEIPGREKLLPPDGVYAVYVHINDRKYPGMLYIGSRETLGKEASRSIEVNIFDFEEDLYGSEIRLDIIEFFRKDRRFDSIEQLQRQLQEDEKEISTYFKSLEERTASVAMAFLNYNGRPYLEKYLDNWLRVGHPSAEVIVIDNGSTDGSVDWLRKFHPEIQCIELKENHGFAGGYNEGLKHLEFDYFALVNTDVELAPDWLGPIVQLMENDSTIAVCQPKILDANLRDMFEYAGGSGGWIDVFGYPFCRGRILHEIERDNGQYDNTQEVFWASGAAFVVRADLFHRFEGFDATYFAHQEEIDLCWRIKRAGYRVMCCPKSVIYHEGGGTLSYNQPRKIYLNFRNNLTTLIKNCSASKLLWLFILRIVLDWLAALRFLTRSQWRNALAILRAQGNVFYRLPALIRKRWYDQFVINHHALTPKSNLRGAYHRSILMDFYLRKLRKFSELPFEE